MLNSNDHPHHQRFFRLYGEIHHINIFGTHTVKLTPHRLCVSYVKIMVPALRVELSCHTLQVCANGNPPCPTGMLKL